MLLCSVRSGGSSRISLALCLTSCGPTSRVVYVAGYVLSGACSRRCVCQCAGHSLCVRWLSACGALQTLIEQHDRNFRYKLLKEKSSLGDVFGKFEQSKEGLGIQEYGVSETTLEQIFVSRRASLPLRLSHPIGCVTCALCLMPLALSAAGIAEPVRRPARGGDGPGEGNGLG